MNKLIREAIDNHGLRLLIISPEDFPSLKKRMSEAQVRHGLAAHYRYRFRDLFPHGGLSVHAKAIERLLKDGK